MSKNTQQEKILGEILNKNFKGVWMPKEVRSDRRLTTTEKLLLALIYSLDVGEGCTETNKNLATKLGLTFLDHVSEMISKLAKLEYITEENFDSKLRVLKITRWEVWMCPESE